MNRLRSIIGACCGVLVACHPTAPASLPPAPVASVKPGLGPGDEIEVRVAGQDELGGFYQVGDDGSIRFPWIGRVDVQGRAQQDVAQAIEARLADGYLRDPQVTVRITMRQNREVSVLGQVKDPGSYPFKERLTLVQALSLAGGLSPLAHTRKVKLIRETQGGRKTFELDLRDILQGRRADLELAPGDIVFVPESPI